MGDSHDSSFVASHPMTKQWKSENPALELDEYSPNWMCWVLLIGDEDSGMGAFGMVGGRSD
jgi:hypothetical protein